MYNHKVYCIVIVVPYRDMVDMAKQAFEEHTQREIREGNAKPGEYTYRVLFHGDYKKDILTQVSDADVVIARGIMYHVLARKLGARVVELQISSYDIIALLDSIKKAGDHRRRQGNEQHDFALGPSKNSFHFSHQVSFCMG